MDNIYVVCWASAGQDDNGNSVAHGGVHSIHLTPESAKKGLEDCKQEFYNDIVYGRDPYGEMASYTEASTQVYGGIVEDIDSCYFEIDYNECDIINEIYMQIEVKEITR